MKNIIKSIVIVLLAACILLTCSKILLLKSEDGISQLKSYYKQKENTVDVLFLGSSHVYCDISTGVLWDEHGIAGYDLGGAEAPSWTSYYHLREALKTQNPKVIFYEISIAAIRPTLNPPEFWVEDNNYGMKWNGNRIDMLRVNTTEELFGKILFPLSAMHGRYNDLSENDFTDVRNTINYKGFDPREYVMPFERPDISSVTEKTPCSEKAEKYLRNIIAYTKERNIPLVLFVSPYVVTEEEQQMYNYMFAIGEEEGVRTIDFNKLYDEMGMDFATDMAEELHLNYSGNYKFSHYLGDLLEKEYSIPDRRGEKNYDSWNVDAANQRIERTDLILVNEMQNPQVFIETAANEGYENFVYLSKDGTDIEESIRENLEKMGISESEMKAGKAFVVKNGRIIEQAEGIFRMSENDTREDLLFVHTDTEGIENTVFMVNGKEYPAGETSAVFAYDTIRGEFVGMSRF